MRKLLPTFLEVAFVGVGLAGVWMVYVPAALILASILGVLAIERRERGAK